MKGFQPAKSNGEKNIAIGLFLEDMVKLNYEIWQEISRKYGVQII